MLGRLVFEGEEKRGGGGGEECMFFFSFEDGLARSMAV